MKRLVTAMIVFGAAALLFTGCESSDATSNTSTSYSNGNSANIGVPADPFSSGSSAGGLSATNEDATFGAVFTSSAKGDFPPNPPQQ